MAWTVNEKNKLTIDKRVLSSANQIFTLVDAEKKARTKDNLVAYFELASFRKC
jgi:hypothetical protein